jgi:D-alanyl-D-alanine carboxypeptidase/D-alanyl-D-alanine-endopeptidase (penicillin-binding protein 4)
MKKLILILLGSIFLIGCSASKQSIESDQFPILIKQVDNIFNDSAFAHAHWGAIIKSLDSDKVWYSRNANKVFMPASNQKIPTTAAAILNLGPEFKFTTNIYLVGSQDDSIFTGDIIIKGNGDPTLYSRFYDSPTEVFRLICDSLLNIGVKKISGNIIGDDNSFDDQHLGNGWSYDYLDSWYAAPVGALQINENYIDLMISPGDSLNGKGLIEPNIKTDAIKIINELVTSDTGRNYIRYNRPFGSNEITVWGRIKIDSKPFEISPSIPDPTDFYIKVFKETLEQNGIIVDGNTIDCDFIENYSLDSTKIYHTITFNSPPLKDIVKILMKRSQNLYAETMVRVIASENGKIGSFNNGREIVQKTFSDIGIKPEEFSYSDGSGLTRYNFISPNQILIILENMYESDFKDLWLDIQPIAGIDGTLIRRMKGTKAEGNVRAKTGTISNVRGLSGYLKTASGENIAFSFLVNGHLLTSRDTERITDSVLELIADYDAN